MPILNPEIEKAYLQLHPGAGRSLFLWTQFIYRIDDANLISDAYEDWLKTSRRAPAPDLVEWISWYGYIDLRLRTWKLPIKLTPVEMKQWQQAGYLVTLEDFYEEHSGVAGGLAAELGKNPTLAIQIIQQQLDEKLAELNRLADLPLEHYTPKAQEWQIRERFAKQYGWSGETLDDEVDLEMLEDDHLFEVRKFKQPFHLREQLESFEWGMEQIRMVVLGEVAPELGLPNKQLFEAFMRIDLNGLLAQLAEVDEKLKRIWNHLAEYKCYCLNAEHEPERFWWRHYKTRPTKRKG